MAKSKLVLDKLLKSLHHFQSVESELGDVAALIEVRQGEGDIHIGINELQIAALCAMRRRKNEQEEQEEEQASAAAAAAAAAATAAPAPTLPPFFAVSLEAAVRYFFLLACPGQAGQAHALAQEYAHKPEALWERLQ